MRLIVPALCASLLALGAPVAVADIMISPQVGAEFDTYVTKEKIKPMTWSGKVAVGAAVPDTVELQPVPHMIVQKDPALKTYKYVYVGNRIALVEPKSRKIVTFVK